MKRERNEDEHGGIHGSPSGARYEIIDPVELARRWVLPVSWVRGHVRNRTADPIPHLRFGRYVLFRWGISPELEGWLVERMVDSRKRSL